MGRDFVLAAHPGIPRPDGAPVLVCILDGWGENTGDQWNAIHVADTPVTDALKLDKKRCGPGAAAGSRCGSPSFHGRPGFAWMRL